MGSSTSLVVTPMRAEKRWGHGRLRQLWRRFVSCRDGHRWSSWAAEGNAHTRRCSRECGAIEVRTWQIMESGRGR